MNSVAETCMVVLPLGLRGTTQPGGTVESVEDVRPERVILRDVGVVEVVGGIAERRGEMLHHDRVGVEHRERRPVRVLPSAET
jgi:hypothetical protein